MSRITSLRTIFFALALGVCAHGAHAQKRGFAVVVDSISYREAKAEILDYVRAIEDMQGMRVYTVIDRWSIPDSIREELKRLYGRKDAPIVGCVFMGDIPVPMIRDAQYLCSAFKMSQKMPWRDSSVPSDRFYDDFGLQFRFLKKDSTAPYFYYSLAAEGDQQVKPNIFSGRIRPTDTDASSRYEKLRAYLSKATYRKRHPERLTSMFVYTGSGSLSESKVAHIDEIISLREHFPASANAKGAFPDGRQTLSNTGVTFSYMDYSDAPYIKTKLMNEMMRPDLSVGLMHHHGDYDTQYLSSYPRPQGRAEALKYLRHCYAQRIGNACRFGENVDSVKQVLRERDGVRSGWLDSLDERQVKELDSIESSRQNLTLPDFRRFGYKPNCRLVLYDACYNGSFHRDDCIANEYIFQSGSTIVGLGATVNVLQDKWPDRYLGLMSLGMMAGYMNMLNADLEMHVVGDPTFCFLPDKDNAKINTGADLTNTEAALSNTGADFSNTGTDLNRLLVSAGHADWHNLLVSSSLPDIQALAVRRLADSGALSSDSLKEIMRFSPYGIVRLEAYLAIRARGYNQDYVDALLLGANDNFELLQRFAVNDIIHCGDVRLTDTYARLLTQNNTSARVAFNALDGVQFFPKQSLIKAVEHCLDSLSVCVINPDDYRQSLMNKISKYFDRWDEDIDRLCMDSLSHRRAMLQADFMRIYLPPYQAAKVAAYAEKVENEELQTALLGALGWHRLGFQAEDVRACVRRMAANRRLPKAVRSEAVRTLKRLTP